MIEALSLTRLPSEAEAIRPRLREFLARTLAQVPVDVRARSWMGFDASFSRALAAQRWVGMTLPAEYDGGWRDGAIAASTID